MKAFTVCEPMGSALIFGGKSIENRRSRQRYTGPILIQAGLSLRWFTFSGWVNARWPGCPESPVLAMDALKHRLGKVIGVVWFDGQGAFEHKPHPSGQPWGATRHHPNPWVTGRWCHPIRHPIAVEPFPAKGMPGLFEIPNTTLPEEVHRAADAVRAAEEAFQAQFRRAV
jgi:hypothetical protein